MKDYRVSDAEQAHMEAQQKSIERLAKRKGITLEEAQLQIQEEEENDPCREVHE